MTRKPKPPMITLRLGVIAELDVCEDCMVAIDRGAGDTHVDSREPDTFARFRCDRCREWIEGTRHYAVTLGR